MTTVHGVLTGPAAAAVTNSAVAAVLVDLSDRPVVGFDVTDKSEILSTLPIPVATDGTWTVQLTPNTQIELAGGVAQTAWRITESAAGAVGSCWIVVPSGGPYWVGDLRTTLVGAQLPSPVTNLAVSGALSVGGTFTLDGVALAAPPNDSSKFLSGNGTWQVGGGAVSSVNGHTGAVVLAASDVGAIQASTFSRDQHASKLGLLLEPFPVEAISEIAPGLGLVSGNLYGQLARPTAPVPLTHIGMWLCSAGSGPTGSSYVALLDESGNQLGVSVDMTSYLTDVTNEGKFIEIPLVAPTAALDLNTGYYPCVLSNLSSIPKIAGCLPSAGTFAIPKMRGHLAGWFLGGQSSVPSHVDLSTVTAAVASYYIVGLPAPS